MVSGIPHGRPIEVEFAPQGRTPTLPLEVIRRSDLMRRKINDEMASRQRIGFHQLVLCTEGSGQHEVDFERLDFRPRTLVRIHPGQVQQFLPDNDFEALMVLWPMESNHADPTAPAWYPGASTPTRWELEQPLHDQLVRWIGELADEQERFVNTPSHRSLMQALLCALLMRLSIAVPTASATGSRLPPAYLDFRQIIEDQLYERPTVVRLARELGYSTRTLDRACHEVVGRTARDVLDERIALEARRLLTHTERPLSRIGTELGFSDASNFTRFVKRTLGERPSVIREESFSPAT